MSYIFEKLQLEDNLLIKGRAFFYKYVGPNTFILNRNPDPSDMNPDLLVLKENIRFVTIFAENNNLSSFFQVSKLLVNRLFG